MTDVSSPDVEGSKKLSRRDFLKWASAVVGSAVLATKVPPATDKLIDNRQFINGMRVVKELTQAKLSDDPEKITESRKLAMVWLFAETAIKFGEGAGYGQAVEMMDHFLYGEGRPFDISPYLEETINKSGGEAFVTKLLSRKINEMSNGKNDVSKIKLIKLLIGEITSLEGLTVSTATYNLDGLTSQDTNNLL